MTCKKDLKINVKFVPKNWGYEKWLVNKQEYCGKVLFIVKDKHTSWHYHNLKDEVFYIQSGSIELLYGETDNMKIACSVILTKGDAFHMPIGMRHRLIATEDSEIIETSTEHFDSDSIRVQID